MKRKRYTEPQIVFALQQAGWGTPVAEICRKMGVAEIRRLRQLEDENRRLKQLARILREALALDASGLPRRARPGVHTMQAPSEGNTPLTGHQA